MLYDIYGHTQRGAQTEKQYSRIFRMPRTAFTDNETYVSQREFPEFLKPKGARQFPAPKTHPQSVGLSQRYVRLILGAMQVRLKADPQKIPNWALEAEFALGGISIRFSRVNGYSSAILMMGYTPIQQHLDQSPGDYLVSNLLKDLRPNY
jgi:hypothetical protein